MRACLCSHSPPIIIAPCRVDQNLKLTSAEVGYGEDANNQLAKRLWNTYFHANPKLFEEVFGYPISEVPAGQTLITMRLWRNEFIAVM